MYKPFIVVLIYTGLAALRSKKRDQCLVQNTEKIQLEKIHYSRVDR